MLKIFLWFLWLSFSLLRGCGGVGVEKKVAKSFGSIRISSTFATANGKTADRAASASGRKSGPGEKNRRKICTSQIFGVRLQRFRLTLQK